MKSFEVVIEIEIQTVTCPGVWLCPNGKITVQIYLLGICEQTSTHDPVFPLLYNEKFTFRKSFTNVINLCDLDNKLDNEIVYIELIQWRDCETGNVLAIFKTYLTDLLYAKTKRVTRRIKVDLLMEATKKFPGILSPKIEILTKVTIKKAISKVDKNNNNNGAKLNFELISPACVPKRIIPVNQKKVCHTNDYYKFEKTFTKSIEHMSRTSKIQSIEDPTTNDETEDDYVSEKIKNIRICTDAPCTCIGKECFCYVCTKYKNYFPVSSIKNNNSSKFAHKTINVEDGQDNNKYQSEEQSQYKSNENNKSIKNGNKISFSSTNSKEYLNEENI